MSVAIMKTKAETALAEGFDRIVAQLPGGSAVRAAREAAMARFQVLGLPHRRVEEWKYTDLRNVLKQFAQANNVNLSDDLRSELRLRSRTIAAAMDGKRVAS